jgi:hypothetical protein
MFGYNPAQTVYFIEFPQNDAALIHYNSNKFIKIHQTLTHNSGTLYHKVIQRMMCKVLMNTSDSSFPKDRTMALGSTHPLTEISIMDISWGKDGQSIGLIILPPSCANSLEI